MSFEPNDPKRPLIWPLTNPTSLGAQTDPNDPVTQITWPVEDDTERVAVSLQLSLQEFTALSTAIDVGRDIAYNENSDYVWFLWVRSVIVSICDQVADCITNDVNVQNALQNFLTENGYGGGAGNPSSPQNYTDDITVIDGSTIEDCDNDNLFGAITQLVDLFNDVLTDAFEGFEAATGKTERVAAILEGIPGVGILPFDDILQFADQMLENLAQNYAAQYDAELRDEYRCDLFCAVKDTCELDFQVMADYFFSRAGATFDEVTFAEAVDWFVFGTFNGDLVVHAAHAILCQILAYGGDFFSLSMSWFTKAATSFLNDPDSDWQTLCECSDGEAYEVDFTEGLGDWVINTGRGTLTGNGIESQVFAGDEQLQIYLIANESFLVKNITIEYEKTGTLSPSDYRVRIGNDVVNGGNFIITQSDPDNGTIIRCNQEINNVTSATGIMIFLRNGGSGDTITLNKVKFWRNADPLPAPLSPNAAIGCYE